MYKYSYDKNQNKISMRNDTEKLMEANITIEGNIAKASFSYIKEIETGTELFSLVSRFCVDSKALLEEQGIHVDEVVFRNFKGILEYDKIYENMNSELLNKGNARVSKR